MQVHLRITQKKTRKYTQISNNGTHTLGKYLSNIFSMKWIGDVLLCKNKIVKSIQIKYLIVINAIDVQFTNFIFN